jgi:hypothetical protein
MDDATVITDVVAGYRMPQPDGCPDSVYTTMLRCWDAKPPARPLFAELVAALATEQRALPSEAHPAATVTEPHTIGSTPLPAIQPEAHYLSGFGGGAAAGSEQAFSDATTNYKSAMYLRVMAIDGEVELADTNSTTSPLDGLAATALVGLRAAVTTAERHITCAGGLSAELEDAFAFAESKVHSGRSQGLTIDQVAAIHLYTQESSFYKGLNGACGGWGAGGKAAISHYLPYLKIAVGAFAALKKIETTVYRGIRGVPLETLLGGKGVGDELSWWACSSTTETADVLRDPQFFGIGAEHGERVVFVIEVKGGVRIKSFSSLGSLLEYYMQPFGATAQNEDEVMLPPGMTFIIDSIEPFTNGVTQVKMHEVALFALPTKEERPADGQAGADASATTSPPLEADGGGGAGGYLQVYAAGPLGNDAPHTFLNNMIIADTYDDDANSSGDEADQWNDGANRMMSSARLLSESYL